MTDSSKQAEHLYHANFSGDHHDTYRQHPSAHQDFHWIEGKAQET